MNYTITLVKDWENLQYYKEIWDRLWYKTKYIENEVYSFEWMKAVAGIKKYNIGKPYCFIIEKNKNVEGIVALFYRQRQYSRLKLKMNTLTLFPNEMTIRHNILIGEISNKLAIRLIVNKIIKQIIEDKIDLIELKGMPQPIVVRLTNLMNLLNYKRYIALDLEEPGASPSDLLAINIETTWDNYFKSRRKQYQRIINKAYKRKSAFGSWEFWRSVGNQTLGNKKKIDEIYHLIRIVENKSWQKEINCHFTRFGRTKCYNLIKILYDQKIEDIAFLFYNQIPIAYYFGSIVKKRGNLYYTSFNSEFKDLSPGTLLFCEIIKNSIQNDVIDNLNLYGLTDKTKFYKKQLSDISDTTNTIFYFNETLKGNIMCYYYNYKMSKRHNLKQVK